MTDLTELMDVRCWMDAGGSTCMHWCDGCLMVYSLRVDGGREAVRGSYCLFWGVLVLKRQISSSRFPVAGSRQALSEFLNVYFVSAAA